MMSKNRHKIIDRMIFKMPLVHILSLLIIFSLPFILISSPSSFADEKKKVLEGASLTQSITDKSKQDNQDNNALKRHVKTRLLAKDYTIGPNEEVWIGIEHSIDPGWHIYWKNPGDSGAAPKVLWDLPKGWKAGEIFWPTPQKLPYQSLVNYGYENHVIFLQKITTPPMLQGGPLHLKAKSEVLVCKETCIPEFQTLEISFNTGGNEQENSKAYQAYITRAEQALPESVNWPANYSEKAGLLVLSIEVGQDFLENFLPKSLEIYPEEWGMIENNASNYAEMSGKHLILTQQRGDRDLKEIKKASFILSALNTSQKRVSYRITAQNLLQNTQQNIAVSSNNFLSRENDPVSIEEANKGQANSPNPSKKNLGTLEAETKAKDKNASLSFISAICFAFLGGIILNFMPCVFPVLSLKALSLTKITNYKEAQRHGLAYSAGVILSFLAIAFSLIALKQSGLAIGWGFHLQNPIVVSLLAYLLFIIGLNLAGFFDISTQLGNLGSFGNIGQKLTQGSGTFNSFCTGMLATIVATPCTAPFMAAALGYAITQSASVNLLIFFFLGLGLSFPYFLFSYLPSLGKILPKPGPWMKNFKELLSFPMFATCAWLLWVVSWQTNSEELLGLFFGLILIVFVFWLIKNKPQKEPQQTFSLILIALGCLSIILLLPSSKAPHNTIANAKPDMAGALDLKNVSDAINPGITKSQSESQSLNGFGETFSQEYLEKLLKGDDPVFVEMTAAWCITCKVNHKIALNIPQTKALFKEKNIKYLIGDWTNQNAEITQYLNSFNRNGVPIYVYYAKRDKETGLRPPPFVLPEILTPNIVKENLK